MNPVKRLIIVFLLFTAYQGWADTVETQDAPSYEQVVTGRADRIVDTMEFGSDTLKLRVRDLIVEHYCFLQVAEEAYDADIERINGNAGLDALLRESMADLRRANLEQQIREHHIAFVASLNVLVGDDRTAQVKDGLTYGVLQVTYNAYCDMIPKLTEEEKEQIMIWLVEAREYAIDGGSSKQKHGWFKKYKGRINNYLSARGYDLKKEEDDWRVRLRAERERQQASSGERGPSG